MASRVLTPPDRIGQIAPSDPDSVRDAGAGAREQHRHFLQSGPRRRDHPHPAAGNDVRERERRPGDVRGPAVGSHHQQSARVGALLERTLRFPRHVVAEQHHVQPTVERVPRLAGRVGPGGRDEHEVRIPHAIEGAVEGAGPPLSTLGGRALSFERFPGPGERVPRPPPRRRRGSRRRDRSVPAASPAEASRPASRMISRFAGVPTIATASSTPGSAARSPEIRISATESR